MTLGVGGASEPAAAAPLAAGISFALGAGLTWGLVFIGPLLLPEYPATLQSFGRYLAFGLIALPLAWFDRRALAGLTRADWLEALKLALVGNLVYYLLLASAIRHAGGPLPTVIIGTLPVVLAVVAKWRASRSTSTRANAPDAAPTAIATATNRPEPAPGWRRLAPSLVAIALGIALVDHAEFGAGRVATAAAADPSSFDRPLLGALLAFGAVACWTWYPLRNGAWLRAHADRSPRAWATAQGLATLPLAFLGYAAAWCWEALAGGGAAAFPMPFGPRPGVFVGLMFAIGLLASWLGTLCWNEASQRLPVTLSGQLIVFETLAALAYAFALRGRWPPAETLGGAALLVVGVAWAARSQRAG